MGVYIVCPKCHTPDVVPPHLHGTRVFCKKCEHLFRAEEAPPSAVPATLPVAEVRPLQGAEEQALPEAVVVSPPVRPKSPAPVLLALAVGLLLGVGGAAGYLATHRPAPPRAPERRAPPGKLAEVPPFTWAIKGGSFDKPLEDSPFVPPPPPPVADPSPDPVPPQPTEAHLAQSMRDLSSPSASTRVVAARFFQYRWPREVDAGRHKAVAHGLAAIAAEPDGPGSRAALAALKNWGGPEALPVLLAASVDRPEESQRLAAEAARQIVARLRSTSPR